MDFRVEEGHAGFDNILMKDAHATFSRPPSSLQRSELVKELLRKNGERFHGNVTEEEENSSQSWLSSLACVAMGAKTASRLYL